MKHGITLLSLALSVIANSAFAELPQKPALNLQAAKVAVNAAAAEAAKRGATVVIAVVDDGGHLVMLERLDNTQVASSDVAVAKARTAAIFRRPSRVFEEQVRNGRISALALPGAVALQGGLPLQAGDQVIGAIGVSGNTPQEDEDIAAAGVAALEQALNQGLPAVTQLSARIVRDAFAKGAPLHEVPGYRIHASRRDAPGIGEVHLTDTDIIYMLEGSATFVTGGELVDAETIAPNEIRGPSIRGGDSRRITKGEVIVVPAGTPHWFKQVDGPVLYYVVKPVSAEGGV
jgi:glc operon protein GlcG